MTEWTKVRLNPSQMLLTKKELSGLPLLYAQDGKGKDAIAYVHFFSGSYDFWATEFDPATGDFFGLAQLSERELGYVTAKELCSIGRIERDLYWTPTPLRNL